MRSPFQAIPLETPDIDYSLETALFCPEPTKTQQQHADEVDINNIVYKYTQTGQMPFTSQNPTFGDFTMATDYHSAMNAIKQAQDAFNGLPATTREKFNNNPAELIDFLADPKNHKEAYTLGLTLTDGSQFEPQTPVTSVSE